MSTVTEEMILAAVRAFNRIPGLFPAMKGALEAAEAVRVKTESNLQKVQIPTSTLPEGHDRANAADDQRWLFSQFQAACATLRERSSYRRGPFLVDESDLPIASSGTQSEQPTIPEGFIPWHGGDCPVAGGTVVDHVLRCRYVVHESAAKSLRWDHLNEDDTRIITDIIAYRIHKPADFRLEAGRFYVTANGERVGPMRVNSFNKSLFEVSAHDPRLWKKNGEPRHGWAEILALSSNQENSDG